MRSKILLIDDEKDFRCEFRDYFDEYDVIEASNGEEALGILKKPNEIEIVILDVKLPGARGTEILKEIKNIMPDLGVIILTGYSSEAVAVAALKGRADEYMEKPIDVNLMKETIQKMLETKDNVTADWSDINAMDKIIRVKNYVERNSCRGVGLSEAASAVALSPKYLSRLFKEKTGKSFNLFRLGVKTGDAKKLLTDTAYNIGQISQKVGYENAESFIRMFKRTTGVSPTAYRKKVAHNKIKKHIS